MASADVQWQGGMNAQPAWQHVPLSLPSGRSSHRRTSKSEDGSGSPEKPKPGFSAQRQVGSASRSERRMGSASRSEVSGTHNLRQRQSTLDVFSLEDVGGLPLEIWREVLSYMSVPILCRSMQVCKSWRHLVNSLDATSWRGHFLRSTEWKEPSWPTVEHRDVTKTWQTLYKEHYLTSRIWTLGNKEPHHAHCLHVFSKKPESKLIRVGPKYEHTNLKSALSVASDYDRILLAPGLYDEQFEMSSKIPFELVGEGELGSVVLLTCIEQNAITARLCNLVLRAPWFTAHVLKVVTGHLQVDNCIIEDGQVSVIAPGTAHFRYCSFLRTQVTCSHVTLSVIENSHFSECETCAVVVEGRPQGEANWAHKYLLHCSDTYKLRLQAHPLRKTQSCHEECSIADFDLGSNLTLDQTGNTAMGATGFGALSLASQSYLAPEGGVNVTDTTSQVVSEASTDTGEWDSESGWSDAAPVTLPTYTAGQKPGPVWLTDDSNSPPLWDRDGRPHLGELLRQDTALREQLTPVIGVVVRQCRITKGQGGVTVSNQGALRIEQSDLVDLQYGIRCLQNAKVVIVENTIHRCSTSGLFMRLGASGTVAGNDIHTTGEAGIDIRKQADPLIQFNRIHHSKRSGIVVLGSGRGTAKHNDIYQNREAGIYILYKGDPFISENRICHGEAAGIAVTESGRGYIGGNLISGNRWGGIDVRRGADPRVTRNLICNGLADGIVIGTKGCGTIDGNIVKGNLGCGIWVMSGRPVIQSNQIHSNKDSGIVLVHKDPDDNQSPPESESDSEAGTDSLVLRTSNVTQPANTSTTTAPGTHHTHLKFNSVYHNLGHGLVASSNDTVLVSGNGFHGNRSTGVYIRQAALVSLIDNSVTCNAGSGIQLTAQSKVELEGNGIYDNIGNGLLVAGDTTVTRNDIFSNQMSAITVEAGANIEVKENRLFAAYDPAVGLEKDVSGAVYNNTIYAGRAQSSICHPEHTTCRIADNTVLPTTQGLDQGVRRGTDWLLEDPPPRPHLQAPPTISIPATPARHVTSVTRVMTPAGGSCQQGSKLCSIL